MTDTSLTVSCDWIQGSFPVEKYRQVRELIEEWFGELHSAGYGRFNYANVDVSLSKVFIAHSMSSLSPRPEFCVGIPGSAMGALDGAEQLELIRLLLACGMRCTRFDIAADDFRKVIQPEELFELAEAGDVIGFKRYQLIRSKTGQGSSMYFGKRGKAGAGRQLCVYDKAAESKGEIDAIRWELRLFKSMADQAFTLLAAAADAGAFARRMGELVAGSINFKKKMGGSVRTDRAAEHPFWSSLVSGLDRVVLKAKKIVSAWREWYVGVKEGRRNIGCVGLAMLRAVLGVDEFREVVDDMCDRGEVRFSPLHKALVREGESWLRVRAFEAMGIPVAPF